MLLPMVHQPFHHLLLFFNWTLSSKLINCEVFNFYTSVVRTLGTGIAFFFAGLFMITYRFRLQPKRDSFVFHWFFIVIAHIKFFTWLEAAVVFVRVLAFTLTAQLPLRLLLLNLFYLSLIHLLDRSLRHFALPLTYPAWPRLNLKFLPCCWLFWLKFFIRIFF